MRQLIIFGDSVIKGVHHCGGKFHLCPDHDFASLQAVGVEAHNYAKMGATIGTGLSILQRRLSACGPGATVLFSFGGNDCDYNWAEIAAAPEAGHLPHTPPERFPELYRQAIQMARDCGAEPVVASIVPLEAERYWRVLSNGLDGARIMQWLGDVHHLYRWQEYYNDLACSTAKAMGCRVIDIRSPFLRQPRFPTLMSDDGIHPSEQGHALLHQVLADALRAE